MSENSVALLYLPDCFRIFLVNIVSLNERCLETTTFVYSVPDCSRMGPTPLCVWSGAE